MTAVTAPPPALQTYLRRATAGLPASRRQEVWDELEEHVYCRAEQLEWRGAAPEQALAQALAELGPPLRVSAGMNGVHNMPKLISIGGIAALAVTAGLYALAGGGNPPLTLPIRTTQPVTPSCVRGTKPSGSNITIVSEKNGVTCYTFNDKKTYEGAFISLSTLQKAVSAHGGTVEHLSGSLWQVTLTGGERIRMVPFFTVGNDLYFLASGLASDLMNRPVKGGAAPQLSGYAQPTLTVGDLKLRFGEGHQNIGPAFYRGLGLELVSSVVYGQPQNHSLSGGETGPLVRVAQTDLPPGEVVLVFTKKAGEVYDTDIVPVGQDGKIQFKTAHEQLRFVADPAQLGPYPTGGRINAMAVRVSHVPLNNLKSGIFLPRSAQ